MLELRESNDILGDRKATHARWAEDGYVFFRNVLPVEALQRVKQRYLDALAAMGVVEPGAAEPVWNGASIDGFPTKVPELYQSRIWRELVATPEVASFFATALGEPVQFMPFVHYRVTPPTNTVNPQHQDGFYNPGINFRICWIPLMDIDEEVGGLAIAPGFHTGDFLHDLDDAPRFRIPDEAVPAWYRSDYHVGDALIFHMRTPHRGLPNSSDRFRLSIDLRLLPASEPQPVVGILTEIEDSHVVVTSSVDGSSIRLTMDDETYIRDLTKARINRSEMSDHFRLGDEIVASETDGTALTIRVGVL